MSNANTAADQMRATIDAIQSTGVVVTGIRLAGKEIHRGGPSDVFAPSETPMLRWCLTGTWPDGSAWQQDKWTS